MGTHGYATTVNALQISSLLEIATTAPPSPPPPAPPTPGTPHYEKPPCHAGEAKASVQGTTGSLCAPPCDASGACPSDVPPNVTAVHSAFSKPNQEISIVRWHVTRMLSVTRREVPNAQSCRLAKVSAHTLACPI